MSVVDQNVLARFLNRQQNFTHLVWIAGGFFVRCTKTKCYKLVTNQLHYFEFLFVRMPCCYFIAGFFFNINGVLNGVSTTYYQLTSLTPGIEGTVRVTCCTVTNITVSLLQAYLKQGRAETQSASGAL